MTVGIFGRTSPTMSILGRPSTPPEPRRTDVDTYSTIALKTTDTGTYARVSDLIGHFEHKLAISQQVAATIPPPSDPKTTAHDRAKHSISRGHINELTEVIDTLRTLLR